MIIIQLTQIDLHTVGKGVQLTRLMSSSWTVTLPLRGEESWVCFKQFKCLSKILSLQWHLLGWCKWSGIFWFIRKVPFSVFCAHLWNGPEHREEPQLEERQHFSGPQQYGLLGCTLMQLEGCWFARPKARSGTCVADEGDNWQLRNSFGTHAPEKTDK